MTEDTQTKTVISSFGDTGTIACHGKKCTINWDNGFAIYKGTKTANGFKKGTMVNGNGSSGVWYATKG